MLGAIDSMLEREQDEDEPLPVLASWRAGQAILQKVGAAATITGMPFEQAVRLFEERKILPKAHFDQLRDAAKKKAFTIAGLAQEELLQEAHGELARQIRDSKEKTFYDEATGKWVYKGPNLREFDKFAKARLETAGWTPKSASHVETIFRTNTMSAYGSGRIIETTQPAVVAARPYWEIRGVNDSRQRPSHRKAQGTILSVDNPFWRKAYPPFGYNCFLPGTVLRGTFTGASRARYSGKAVELTSTKGRQLSVTANHPILTTSGFVPAQLLRNGDQLVGYLDESGISLLRSGSQGNKNNIPASVEEIFDALAQASSVDLASAGSDDFHGEARFFDGEVDVVGSYGRLHRNAESALAKQQSEIDLKAADPAGVTLCSGGQLCVGALPAANSRPGAFALPLDGSTVELEFGPLDALGFGLPAQLGSVLTEDASDGLAADAELLRELIRRGSGLVELDDVASVREFNFSGHVYDFESVNGWMFANSIVSSNCRCRVISRSKRWVDAHGGPTRVPDGLPDKGFSSGIDASLVPAPLPVPSEGKRAPVPGKAANPIDRPGLYQPPVSPPAYRAPPIQISPTPPELPKAPIAPVPVVVPTPGIVSAGVHAREVVVADGVTKRQAARVLGAFNENELEWLRENPASKLSLVKNHTVYGIDAVGSYDRVDDAFTVVATRDPSTYGRKLVPGSRTFSSTRSTAEAAAQATARHELGHRMHMRAPWYIQTQVDLAFVKATPITKYGASNSQEWFAESYAMYREIPDALKLHDPEGFRIVRYVLDHWGIQHGTP